MGFRASFSGPWRQRCYQMIRLLLLLVYLTIKEIILIFIWRFNSKCWKPKIHRLFLELFYFLQFKYKFVFCKRLKMQRDTLFRNTIFCCAAFLVPHLGGCPVEGDEWCVWCSSALGSSLPPLWLHSRAKQICGSGVPLVKCRLYRGGRGRSKKVEWIHRHRFVFIILLFKNHLWIQLCL